MKRWLPFAVALTCAAPTTAESLEEHDYILNCSGCHRLDGSGSRTVPSLHAMKDLASRPGARSYWIRVPGVAQAPLSDARLAALMNWLVHRFTGERPKPLYTPPEVRTLRRNPYRDPKRQREGLRAPESR